MTLTGKRRGQYRALVGKREGKKPLGNLGVAWRIIIKWILNVV